MTFAGGFTAALRPLRTAPGNGSGLTAGRHIIKVTKDGLSYQVVTARGIGYKLVNAEGTELTAGRQRSSRAIRSRSVYNLIGPKGYFLWRIQLQRRHTLRCRWHLL